MCPAAGYTADIRAESAVGHALWRRTVPRGRARCQRRDLSLSASTSTSKARRQETLSHRLQTLPAAAFLVLSAFATNRAPPAGVKQSEQTAERGSSVRLIPDRTRCARIRFILDRNRPEPPPPHGDHGGDSSRRFPPVPFAGPFCCRTRSHCVRSPPSGVPRVPAAC